MNAWIVMAFGDEDSPYADEPSVSYDMTIASRTISSYKLVI